MWCPCCMLVLTMSLLATKSSVWRQVDLPPAPASQPSLALLAERSAKALQAAGQRVCCFESTTGGLIQASLLAAPGASSFTSCGAVSYTSSKAVAVLGPEAQPLGEPLDALGHRCRPKNGAEYIASKQQRVEALARRKRLEVGSTWSICENGACGPTFNYDDLHTGFTAIFVSGPVERGLLVRSAHGRREDNMWGFTQVALDFLADCVAEAAALAEASEATIEASETAPSLLQIQEDRYGGVEVAVPDGSPHEITTFVRELHGALDTWQAAGKRGVWLTLPLACHSYVSAAVSAGFTYHHATAEYLMLTRWLPATPSPLPRYGFTQIGVGGVVVNGRGEVLMVVERVSPLARMQGSYKLPGGLSDPGEDFAQTVAREVLEETGVATELDGVVSLRHAHGRRFDQGDLYVIVRLRATAEEITIDEAELAEARWMSREEIERIVETDDEASSKADLGGKISKGNYEMIDNALRGELIEGVELPSSKGIITMLYRAPRRS